MTAITFTVVVSLESVGFRAGFDDFSAWARRNDRRVVACTWPAPSHQREKNEPRVGSSVHRIRILSISGSPDISRFYRAVKIGTSDFYEPK